MTRSHSGWVFASCMVLLAAACESSTSSEPEPDAGVTPSEDAAPSEKCVTPTGDGTKHPQNLASDNEVWTAAGSPHIVDFGLTIREGEKLTIEPCAVVRFKTNVGLLVQGDLNAEGDADRPILFERADAESWSNIQARKTAKVRLAYAKLTGGGRPGTTDLDKTATLVVQGDPSSPNGVQPIVHVDHVTIDGSESLGANLAENSAFTDDSRELTITGSASAPVRIWQRAVSSLPTGTYTGNQANEFLIDGGNFGDYEIVGEVTIRDRGLPYRVTYASLHVGSDTQTGALTIEPGVTLRFDSTRSLTVGTKTTDQVATGTLRAIGTADKPIVFTSAAATPTAGDWVGIVFKGTPSANNRIEHATIAYAGGGSLFSSYDCYYQALEEDGGDDGAIVIAADAAGPAAAFVTNTRIEHSAKFGIVRGWRGDPVDFLTTNEFVDVPKCKQSYPRGSDINGSCPEELPCPDGVPR